MNLLVRFWLLTLFLGCAVANPGNTPTPTPTTVVVGELTLEGVFVIVCLLLMVLAMVLDLIGATAALAFTSLVFTVTGVITSQDLFSGFSNSGVVAQALLFVLVNPIARLPIVRAFFTRLLRPGEKGSTLMPLLRLCAVSAVVSTFVDNASHVALMTPIVTNLCAENNIPVGQMLMPMSAMIVIANGSLFASSSNLVAMGILEKVNVHMPLFELSKVCTFVALLMIGVVAALAPKLLPTDVPDKHGGGAGGNASGANLSRIDNVTTAKFNVAMNIPVGNRYVGKQLQDMISALPPNMTTVCLTELRRSLGNNNNNNDLASLTDSDSAVFSTSSFGGINQDVDQIVLHDLNEVVAAGDHVVWKGPVADIRTVRRILCLEWVASSAWQQPAKRAPTNDEAKEMQEQEQQQEEISSPAPMAAATIPLSAPINLPFCEVTLTAQTHGIGTIIRSHQFERFYHVTILSVVPRGETHSVCGDAMMLHILMEGDVLLVRAESSFFVSQYKNDYHTFYYFKQHGITAHTVVATQYISLPLWFPYGQVIHAQNSRYVRLPAWYGNIVIAIYGAVVVAAVCGVKLSVGALFGVCVMVILRVMTVKDALKNIDWNVIVSAGFSFGIGASMGRSGLADYIATTLVTVKMDGLPLLLLLGSVTCVIANVVGNRTAVQVMIPVVASVFRTMGKDPLIGCVVVANGAVGAFMTPFGLPPNLIIMAPGGYKPKDFLIFGAPLAVLFTVLHCIVTAIVYQFW